jgi:hypothetical protein
VIAFIVVMGHEVVYGCTQRLLSKQDHLFQTGLLDGPHESLGMRIQIHSRIDYGRCGPAPSLAYASLLDSFAGLSNGGQQHTGVKTGEAL